MCDIIIPVWNQPEDTKDCIDSLERNTLYPYRLVIIDNASDSKTAKYLANLKKNHNMDIALVRNEQNEGFIKAVNKGILLSTAEYVCILNNDTVVTRGWLDEMVNILNKDPKIGIVNPASNTLGQKLPREMTPDEIARGMKNQSGLFAELGNAVGFCMLARKKLFDEIGLFDEVFGIGNFEDTDFSMRAKEKGYRTVRALASYVLHKERKSFGKLKNFKKDFERNKRIFEAKWGKQKRITYIFKDLKDIALDNLKDLIEDNIKKGYWVYIYSASGKIKDFFAAYPNITCYNFAIFFYIATFLKLVFKKKKSDIIYCDNSFFLNFLAMFQISHGARIEKLANA